MSLSDRLRAFTRSLSRQYSRRLGSSGEAVPFTITCRWILNQPNLSRCLPVAFSPKTQRSLRLLFSWPQYRAAIQPQGLFGCERLAYRLSLVNIQLSISEKALDETPTRK